MQLPCGLICLWNMANACNVGYYSETNVNVKSQSAGNN